MREQYYSPQVITFFVPSLRNKDKILVVEADYPNDWVAFANEMDEKYGIWFMTLREAQNIMGKEAKNEIKV